MTFYTKVRGHQRMNPNDLSDPLTFPVVPPGGQSFYLTSETSKHLFQELASNFYTNIQGSQLIIFTFSAPL